MFPIGIGNLIRIVLKPLSCTKNLPGGSGSDPGSTCALHRVRGAEAKVQEEEERHERKLKINECIQIMHLQLIAERRAL